MKKVFAIILALAGILSLAFGIVTLAQKASYNSTGYYKSGNDAEFGADFYTIVNENAEAIAHNTAKLADDLAETSNDLSRMLKLVNNSLGYLLIVIGVANIGLGGFAFAKCSCKKEKINEVAVAPQIDTEVAAEPAPVVDNANVAPSAEEEPVVEVQ